MITRFTTAVFPIFKDKVLLVHHKKLNTWLPPGGKMDPGETPSQCARRELLEETGLSGEYPESKDQPHGTPDGFLAYEEHFIHSLNELHMNFVFICYVGTDCIIPDGSYYDYKWLTVEEAKKLATNQNVIDCLDLLSK